MHQGGGPIWSGNIEKRWAKGVEDRIEALERGELKTISAEDFFRRLPNGTNERFISTATKSFLSYQKSFWYTRFVSGAEC